MTEIGQPGPAQPTYEGYPQPTEEMGVVHYVRLFLEYRWWIIGVTVAVTLLGAIKVFLATPMYTAGTTIFFDIGTPAKGAEISKNYSADYFAMSELFFTSQSDVIRSKEVAEEAFNTLNLKDHPAFQNMRDPVAAFRSMINVQRKKDSAIFIISMTCPSQKDVAVWTNAAAEAYITVTLRQKMKTLSDANKLMTQQVKEMEKEYARLGEQYSTYLQKTGSYFPQNQRAINDARIQQLELRRNQILIDKSSVEAKLSQLRGVQSQERDPLTIVSIKEDPSIRTLVDQYNQAQKDLAQLTTQLTPKHPRVIKKQEEIEAIRKRIRDQAVITLRSYESQYAALSKEYADLSAELDNLKIQSAQFTGGSSQGEAMQQGVDAVRNYMNLLTQKIQEVDVAANLTTNSVRIVDRAVTPGGPSYPRKARTILLSFLIGLMGSAGAIVLLQFFDTRIKDPDVIEKKLGLSLLATIPSHSPESKSLVVEAFQNLRTSLIYLSDNKARNVIMITSPSAAEGKSTVVANLGITLAASGEKVLLIDCDARKAALHKYFQLSVQKGLPDFLAVSDEDPTSFIIPTDKPNLSLMPAGKTHVNPPTLYTMEKFHRFLDWARKSFTWVIVDTPPIIAVTDASIIANYSDITLLVVRFKITHTPLIEQAQAHFDRIGKPISGAVLNQFEWAKDYYYKHYYYKHYSYYHKMEPPPTIWDKVAGAFGKTKRGSQAQTKVRVKL